MQYITWVATIITLVGTVANSLQKRWCFYVWGITNLFWCGYNFTIHEYGQSLVYAANLIICLFGLKKWKKKMEAQNIIALCREDHEALHKKGE